MERFNSAQTRLMIEVSKRFEHAWKVLTRPPRYSLDEINEVGKFLNENIGNIQTSAQLDPNSAEIYERISMGIYHHPEIQMPPEHKYHPKAN